MNMSSICGKGAGVKIGMVPCKPGENLTENRCGYPSCRAADSCIFQTVGKKHGGWRYDWIAVDLVTDITECSGGLGKVFRMKPYLGSQDCKPIKLF